MAAITRTSTVCVRSAPSGSNSRSCSTRSSFACTASADRADLVEEDRAAVGQREAALLGERRAGEGAAHVAEQLGLEQRLRESPRSSP